MFGRITRRRHVSATTWPVPTCLSWTPRRGHPFESTLTRTFWKYNSWDPSQLNRVEKNHTAIVITTRSPPLKCSFLSNVSLWPLCICSGHREGTLSRLGKWLLMSLTFSISALRFRGRSCYVPKLLWIGFLGHSREIVHTQHASGRGYGRYRTHGWTWGVLLCHAIPKQTKTAEPNKNDNDSTTTKQDQQQWYERH